MEEQFSTEDLKEFEYSQAPRRSDFCFHIHFLLSCSPLGFSLRYANYCQIISQYGWLSVEHLIYYDLGVFMYKTMNGLSTAISSFQNVKDIHQYQTRSATNGNLYIANVNTLAGQRAIHAAGAKLWNEIPTEIRNAESLDTFSSKLKTFYLSQQLHPHSCIPAARRRCDSGQIENSNTWEFLLQLL